MVKTTNAILGNRVECEITGVSGIATARAANLDGTVTIYIQPGAAPTGSHQEGRWVDERAIKDHGPVSGITKRFQPSRKERRPFRKS